MKPYAVSFDQVSDHLEEFVDETFADLQSQFLVLPKGKGFVAFDSFQAAYEVLKRQTSAFRVFTRERTWSAFSEDALSFVVLRTILGLSPPEWAELVDGAEIDVPQGAARGFDTRVRKDRGYFRTANPVALRTETHRRVDAMVRAAVALVEKGGTGAGTDAIHRLAKFDTEAGLASLCHAADHHVPYAVLLYERYLGRPFASHRDSVSELIGEVMENAIEDRLLASRVTFRQTGRAERIPGWEQAPDFFVPTEAAAHVVIEAKITNDGGTARDKVSRILRLASMRDERARKGDPTFELVACIDGRGFGVRRNDMRDLIIATKGKVFTLATLGDLVENTGIRAFKARGS